MQRPKISASSGSGASHPVGGGEGVTSHRPLTEAAIAAMEAFEQGNSWIGRGEAPGMPAFMHSRNHFEFIDQGDSIRYVQPVLGVARTIHLNSAENPEDQPHSPSRILGRRGGWRYADGRNDPAQLALSEPDGYSDKRAGAHHRTFYVERRSGSTGLSHDRHRSGELHRAGDLFAPLDCAGESSAGGTVYAGLADHPQRAIHRCGGIFTMPWECLRRLARTRPALDATRRSADQSIRTPGRPRCASTVNCRLTYMKKPFSLP